MRHLFCLSLSLILVLALAAMPLAAQEPASNEEFAAKVFKAMKDGVEAKDVDLFFRNFAANCKEDDGTLFLPEERALITKLFEENETLTYEYNLISVEEDANDLIKVTASWKLGTEQGGEDEGGILWINEEGKIVRVQLADEDEADAAMPGTVPSEARPEPADSPAPPEGLSTDLRPDDPKPAPENDDVEPEASTLNLGESGGDIPDSAVPKNDKIDYGNYR